MRRMLIIIAIVLIALFLAKDFLASTFLSFGIRSFTDLTASVKNLNLDVFNNIVDVKGFYLYNPKRIFKDRVMADMPELYIAYDPGSLLKGTKYLKKVRLNLREFVVVKNENGELNLDSLKAIRAKAGAGKEKPQFKIDVLELKIGKVVYKDYSKAGKPFIKEFNVNLDERYENITNPNALASLIVFKALVNTNIAALANFDLGPLKNAVSGAAAKATKIATQAAETTAELGKTAGQATKGAITRTTETIKKLFPGDEK